MIKHIVAFKLKKENKEANASKMKTILEDLVGKIEEIVALEVGIDFSNTDASYDVSLYSTFESKGDLETYAVHPLHLECVAFIKTVITSRIVVDYEL